MTLKKLSKSTEDIQDIVGSLIGGSGDANVTYDDANDQLSIDVSVEDTIAYIQTSSPSNPVKGEIWYNNDNGVASIYADRGSGAKWYPIPPIQSTQEFTTFTEDNLIYNGFGAGPSKNSFGPARSQLVEDWENQSFDITANQEFATKITGGGWRLQHNLYQGSVSTTDKNSRQAISGNRSVHVYTGGSGGEDIEIIRETELKQGMEFTIRGEFGSSYDDGDIYLRDGSYNYVARIEYEYLSSHDLRWNWVDESSTSTYLANPEDTVTFRIIPDFNNTECEVYVNGQSFGKLPFRDSSATGIKTLRISAGNSNAGFNYAVDDIYSIPKVNNGYSIIQWQQGVEDINQYEQLSYRGNNDGESYTIDLMDKQSGVTVHDFSNGIANVPSPLWDGWNGYTYYDPDPDYTEYFIASPEQSISGEYSGLMYADNTSISNNIEYKNGVTTDNVKIDIKIQGDTNDAGSSVDLDFRGDSEVMGNIRFFDDNGNVTFYGQQLMSSWSTNTVYSIEMNWDFPNSNVDIIINGTNQGTYSFNSSIDGFKRLEISNDAANTSRSVNVDNFVCTGLAKNYSNINKDFDISMIPSDKELYVQFRFSRTNTSNFPHIDYLARRVIR